MQLRSLSKIALLFSAQSLVLLASPFGQTNLVSNVPGLAATLDANLKNPWGMSFSGTSPIWVSNQGSNNSTLYTGTGVPQALVVTVPPTSPPPTGPTGTVFNSAGAGNFLSPANGAASNFIFATLAGSIDAWNGSNGTTASVVASTAGAVYTGLAIGNNGSNNFLYAANFAGGRIDVFNSSFAPTTLAGSFTDPNLPAGYVPYNVQNLNGKLYVEYATVNPVTHEAAVGAGLGIVDLFDANGNFLQRLASNGSLNAPWGIAIAPAGFGEFGGDVLVGNFGDGKINAFNPVSGNWLGVLTDSSGNPIVNDGLWGIAFGNSSANPNALYFSAGINDEADGLFGEIQAVPEPAAAALLGLGCLGMAVIARRRRAR
jgi:uncharacterized protein (TIGR03118 family)